MNWTGVATRACSQAGSIAWTPKGSASIGSASGADRAIAQATRRHSAARRRSAGSGTDAPSPACRLEGSGRGVAA